MNKYQLKKKLKNTPMSTWLYRLAILGVIIIAIVCSLIAMHLCGYTLATWFAKFYGYVVLVSIGVISLIVTYLWWKVRKK